MTSKPLNARTGGFQLPPMRLLYQHFEVLGYQSRSKTTCGSPLVSQTATTVRVDVALTTAFGLPGCADQSVLADTLDAAREADVADLAAAIADLFGQYSQARQHAFEKALLVLDVDLSPDPSSKHAEGSERGYLGRSRSETGCKLVRVQAAATGESVWETVISTRSVESLPVLQEA